jgi:glycosyltransferase involved in cell wall biosynthesis
MKILVLSNKAPFPANDGSSIAIANLALGLADNGIDLHLLTINTKKHFKADEKIDAFIKEKTHYQSVYKDTNPSMFGAFLNLLSSHSYFVSRFYFSEFEQALIHQLKTQTFDIIQLEGVFMASYIPIIKKYSKSKITLRAHNVEHQIWDRLLIQEKSILKRAYLSLQNKRLKKFELQAFEKCDAIVTITDIDKQTIKSLMPSQKIETCLTGLNLMDYVPVTLPKKQNTVFHFASMDWMPNVEAVDWLLEKVWKDVLKEIPDAKLILAGRGMPTSLLQKASASITIIDNVPSSSEFYNTYDIMLVPLWSGSGLRIKLVEGLAYGKAIITTSIGAEGIPYVANEHVMIADNHTEFIRAIITLLKDEQTKLALQQEARHLAEKEFDYKRVAETLIKFYTQLLKA